MLKGMETSPENTDNNDEDSDKIEFDIGYIWSELAENTAKVAAKFVWCYYTLDRSTDNSGIGEVGLLVNSASRKSPQDKFVRVWNEMLWDIKIILKWINDNRDNYPDFQSDEELFGRYFANGENNVREENIFGI